MSLAELRFSLSQSPLLVALKILVFRWALGGPGDYYTDIWHKPYKIRKENKEKNTNINMNRARSYCLPKHR